MNEPFIWTGACEAISLLVPKTDYICSYTDSLLTFIRYQNQSHLAISNHESLKFKIQLKNPNKAKIGGLEVRLVSNYVRYIYEVKNLTGLFKTNIMTLFSGSATYLWGLTKSTNTPCPIRTYLSVELAVWNKISFNFFPSLSFPSCIIIYFLYFF